MPPHRPPTGEAAPKTHGDRSGNVRVWTAYALALMGGATALGYGAYDTGSWPFDNPNCGIEDPTHANKVGNSAQEAARTLGEQRGYYISSYRMAIVNNVQVTQYQPGRFCWEVPAPVIQGQVVIESPQTVADIAKFHGMSPEQLRALNVGNGYLPAGDNTPLDPGALLWTSDTVPPNIHDALVEQTLTQDLATIVQSATAEQQTGIIAANFTLFMRGQTAAGGTAKLPASSKSVPYVGEYATRGAYTPGAPIDGRPPSGVPQEQPGPTPTPSSTKVERGPKGELVITMGPNPIDVPAAAANFKINVPNADDWTAEVGGERVPMHNFDNTQLWQIVNENMAAVRLTREGYEEFKRNFIDYSEQVLNDGRLTDFHNPRGSSVTIDDVRKFQNIIFHITITRDGVNDLIGWAPVGDSGATVLQNAQDGAIVPEFYVNRLGQACRLTPWPTNHIRPNTRNVNNGNSVGMEFAAGQIPGVNTKMLEAGAYWAIMLLEERIDKNDPNHHAVAYINEHVLGHNVQGQSLPDPEDIHDDWPDYAMVPYKDAMGRFMVQILGYNP